MKDFDYDALIAFRHQMKLQELHKNTVCNIIREIDEAIEYLQAAKNDLLILEMERRK